MPAALVWENHFDAIDIYLDTIGTGRLTLFADGQNSYTSEASTYVQTADWE